MRGYQWWGVGSPVAAGEGAETARFNIEDMFKVSPTNDYILKISPLLYRVGTNGIDARLVEFPPTKVFLKANGQVEKLE
jgi:hypothetical protein